MGTKYLVAIIFTITALTVIAMSDKQSLQLGFTPNEVKPDVNPQLITNNNKPKVELVFVLDTTGSMSGLISAAKEKVWSIASTMAAAKPTPEISIGIVGYRDKGDLYVTKRVDLSKDLDSVYADLLDFQADGGGDSPESVNAGLYQAVHGMSWSNNPNSYKVIFLVGDAPGHNDYQDDVPFDVTLAAAARKGITVNTIQAGNNPLMVKSWRRIAALGNGDTFQVGQQGSAIAVTTPFDDSIAIASKEYEASRIYYGNNQDKERQKLQEEKTEKIYAGASTSSIARRAKFNASSGGEDNFIGRNEMIEALKKKEIVLADMEIDELPLEMQTMKVEEREGYVQSKMKQRKEAKLKLKELSEKRDEFITAELAKSSKTKLSLDEKMFATLKSQAEKKGIDYSEAESSY